MVWLWAFAAWLSGSLMFSYWLGLLVHRRLETVGDGNPGGVNLLKAAGIGWGLLGIALDFLKGYVPVFVLSYSGAVSGYALVPIVVAPVLGHAFSPFMRFRGGKAIAVTFGVWSALTGFEVSLALAVLLAILRLIDKASRRSRPSMPESDAVQVMLGMLLVYVYMYIAGFAAYYLWCWLGNFAVLLYTHRREIGVYVGRVTALWRHHS